MALLQQISSTLQIGLNPILNVSALVLAAVSISAVSTAIISFYSFDQWYDGLNVDLYANETFDFIIVGAGSAGCVLANRLSVNPNNKVLLLEAGGNPHPLQSIPLLAFNLLNQDFIDWKFKTSPSRFACTAYQDGVCGVARGKGLGGSSNLNYMIYSRGHPKDYEQWEKATGDFRWGYENVLKYFKKSENYMGNYENDKYHGKGGLLSVRVSPYEEGIKLASAFVDAAVEQGYHKGDVNSELVGETFSATESTITSKGKRASSNQAFLEPATGRPNLHVLKYAHVTKVLTKRNYMGQLEAYGVEYSRHGLLQQVFVRKEVILSAGALMSPHILMHSGIGPEDELRKHGIEVKLNLDGVGRNLQDHVGGFVGPFTIDEKISFVAPRDASLKNALRFSVDGSGPFSSSTATAFGHISTSAAKLVDGKSSNWTDVQFLLIGTGLFRSSSEFYQSVAGVPAETVRDAFEPTDGKFQDGFLIITIVTRPKSRGRILLSSSDPGSSPVVDVNLLSHPDDIKTLVEGSEKAANLILNSTAFRNWNVQKPSVPFPGCEQFAILSPEYWECLHRQLTISVYHYGGTCQMGKVDGNESVVDPELRVKGMINLRVVDASVMPVVINSNTNAPTIMIAEMASDFILKHALQGTVT